MTFNEKVIVMKSIDVPAEGVMTLTEAGARLGLSVTSVNGLLQRGRLRWIVDPREPNPTRASRVLRVDVEREATRRRGRRRVDARLAAAAR